MSNLSPYLGEALQFCPVALRFMYFKGAGQASTNAVIGELPEDFTLALLNDWQFPQGVQVMLYAPNKDSRVEYADDIEQAIEVVAAHVMKVVEAI